MAPGWLWGVLQRLFLTPLRRIVGHSEVSFHHHYNGIRLTTKEESQQCLIDLCRSVTPSCWLNPLLFNGHMQTCWTAVTSAEIEVYYKRKIFHSDDPIYTGDFAVDFTVESHNFTQPDLPPRTASYNDDEWQRVQGGSTDSKPMAIVLHGLAGGSNEVYLRAVLKPLVDAGWQACVVNARGCAMSEITSEVLYNARATWDVRQTVKWLRATYPHRPLFGLGFSLGANILVNYIGEEGISCAFKAAVVCSNPWDMDVSNKFLQSTWLGLHVYSRAMGSSLKRLFDRHAKSLERNTRLDLEKVRGMRYLHEFDRFVQCPTWGYPTEGAYYRDASSIDVLLAVKIPLFALNAEDDPIASRHALPLQEVQQNPFVVLCTTTLGGHLSWFELGGARWFAKPASNFLKKFASSIDLEKPSVVQQEVAGNGVVDFPYRFNPVRRKLELTVTSRAQNFAH